MDRAIDYIRTLQPEAVEGLRPASDAEIDELESSRGIRFSEIHRTFLKRMGNGVGGLDFGPADPTLAALRQAFENTTGSPPPDCELFAVSGDDPYLDVFLLRRGEGEPAIGLAYSVFGGDFESLDTEGMSIVAGSLSELLCHMPYVRARYEPKPLKFTLTNRQPVEGAMDRFDRVIRENGLELVWFSTAMTRVAEFGETVLLAKQVPGTPLAVSIGSSNRIEFAAAHWWMTHDVGLEIAP